MNTPSDPTSSPTRDDETWDEISDRIALGDRLGPDERKRYEELRAQDELRAREDATWEASITELGRAAPGGRSNEELTQAVLRQADTASRFSWLAAAAAAVILAGGTWWATQASQPDPGPPNLQAAAAPQAAPTAPKPPDKSAAPSPMAWANPTGAWGRSADGQARAAQTDGCFSLEQAQAKLIEVCVTAGTEIRMRGLNRAASTIELRKGTLTAHVWHDKVPTGHRFAVTTSAGTVTAIGTVFTVEVDERGTRAQVTKGTIEVEPRQGALQQLTAPASHWLETSSDSDGPVPPSQKPQGRRPSAPSLQALAQDARRAGEFGKAAQYYEMLLEFHPQAASARPAAVALGDLKLERLGDAGAALELYEHYLEQPGPLAEEADLGRIRALLRLGRRAEHEAAVARFLERYPASFHAGELRNADRRK